jgi:hypothetical protein
MFGEAVLQSRLLVLGLLGSPFFDLPFVRAKLIGDATVSWQAALGLQLLTGAAAWLYLLRRGFVWADPAVLTWLDFSAPDRGAAVGRRLWSTWAVLLAVLGYLTGLSAAIDAAAPAVWALDGALLVGGALVSLGLARRADLAGWAAVGWPLALAVLGVLVVVTGPPLPAVAGLAVVFPLAAVPAWWGTGGSRSPVAAAGRDLLVGNWRGRLVRSAALSFLDPTMLLPAARAAVRWSLRPTVRWSLRPPVLVRLAWAGVAGRARYATPALVYAFVVAVAHVALPSVPLVLLVTAGGYLAVVPFAGGLGELWHSPGRRRWIGSPDLAVRGAHALVLAGVCALWAGLTGAIMVLVHAPPGDAALWWATAVAGAAVVRTATRPPVRYDRLGFVDTPFGALPPGLLTQTLRGPDVCVVGCWLLIADPLGVWTPPVVLAVIAWGLLR